MNEPFFKGNAHHAALMRNLGGSGNTHQQSHAPANPATAIRRSSPDESLQRHNPEAEAETAYERRRKKMSGGNSNAGAFDKLRRQVREHVAEHGPLEKAIPGDYSIGQAMSDLRSVPLPSTAGASKLLLKGMAKTARALGNANLAKSLEAGYGSDSATLTGGSALSKQSLSKRVASTTVGGDPKSAKKREPTGDEILKAASAALYAGQIDAKDAQAIQHHVGMTGKCPEPLLKKLRDDEDAPNMSRVLTKEECRAACAKGLNAGSITGAEAIHVDIALSLDHHIDDGIMARLKAVHAGASNET